MRIVYIWQIGTYLKTFKKMGQKKRRNQKANPRGPTAYRKDPQEKNVKRNSTRTFSGPAEKSSRTPSTINEKYQPLL